MADVLEQLDELSCTVPILDFYFNNQTSDRSDFPAKDESVFEAFCVDAGQTVEILFEVSGTNLGGGKTFIPQIYA